MKAIFMGLVMALVFSFSMPVAPARAESPLVRLYKSLLSSLGSLRTHRIPAENSSGVSETGPVEEEEVVRTLRITLEWDPSDDGRVAGYKLYYGNASGKYLDPIDVGLKTTFTVSGLDDGKTWYFAVKAYDAGSVESDYSNEVVKMPGEEIRMAMPGTTAPDQGPQVLNEEFGDEPPVSEAANGELPTGGGRIVAGIGSWPANGGWVKVLTGDYLHDRWARLDWDRYNHLNGETRVARGDIDGDGRDELIIGMGLAAGDETVPNGTFEVLDDDLSHLCWGQVNWESYNESNGETWPTCGDFDGDGRAEILIGMGRGGQGNIEVFGYVDGGVVHKSWLTSTWSEYNRAQGETRPAVGDYDGDGKNDVIIGFGPVGESVQLPGGAYEVLAADGSHLAWGEVSWGDYNDLNGETRPAVGDLDGDGLDEIVIGLGAGANGAFEIQKLDYQGRLVNEAWLEVPEWLEYNQENGETRPAVGNLDDDPEAEIVVARGPFGGGWIHLFDDQESGYRQFLSLQLWPDKYNTGNGASWVTIMENR